MDVRIVLWTCLVMTAFMMCTHTLFLPMLFSVIVMGIIPGTTIEIPTGFMLIVYPSLFIAGVYWFSTLQVMMNEHAQAPARAPKKSVRKKTVVASSPTTPDRHRSRVAV